MADLGQTQWNLWWVAQVLTGAAPPGSSLLFSPVLFAPVGGNLVWHTGDLFWGIVLLPLRLLAGPLVQHNAALILATWLTGWFTYLAARQAGARTAGALIAAIAIAIHPYRLGEAHHLNIFSTSFLPLALYLLLRLGPPRSGAAQPRAFVLAILLGLCGAGVLLASLFHAFCIAIIAVGMIAWFLIHGDSAYRRSLPISLVPAMVIPLPIVAWLGIAMVRAQAPPGFPTSQLEGSSADVWQYILHPRLRMALGGSPTSAAELYLMGSFRPLQWYLPGYLLAILAILVSIRDRSVRPWLYGAAAFALLSLGPSLKIGSPAYINPGATALPLPYRLLLWIPVLGTVRSLWHFGFIATILAAIAGARGIDMLLHWSARRNVPRAGLILGTIVFLESFVGSIPSVPRADSPMIIALRDDPRPGAVIVQPFALYEIRGLAMYDQTLHQRPILTGYTSRDPQSFELWKQQRRWPVEMEQSLFGRGPMSPAADQNYRQDISEIPTMSILIYDTSERRFLINNARETWPTLAEEPTPTITRAVVPLPN